MEIAYIKELKRLGTVILNAKAVEKRWTDYDKRRQAGLERDERLNTDYYSIYIGCYCKRFYTKFEEDTISKIVGFRFINGCPHFEAELRYGTVDYDVEDCIVITNDRFDPEDDRVISVNSEHYKGWDPYYKMTRLYNAPKK